MRDVGLHPKVWIRVPERRTIMRDNSILQLDFNEVAGCRFDPRGLVAAPFQFRRELYEEYGGMFRRHFLRQAPRWSEENRSWTHVDSLFHLAVSYFRHILLSNEIETLVFANLPHIGSEIVLYAVAKRLGCRTIICSQSQFPALFWMYDTINGHSSPIPPAICTKEFNGVILAPTLPKDLEVPFYMTGKRKMWLRGVYEIASGAADVFKLIGKIALFYPIHSPASFRRNMNRLAIKWDRSYFRRPNYGVADFKSLTGDFVYFPLHLQPELTTDTQGGVFGDQLLAIEWLAEILPADVSIAVKENPKQTRFMREWSFYQRLSSISKVIVLSSDVSSFELIRRSRAVATVTGTAGWEALVAGRPCILFGSVWYKDLPGVFLWDSPEVWDKCEAYMFDRQVLEESFGALIKSLHTGVVDWVYEGLVDPSIRKQIALQTARSLSDVLSRRSVPASGGSD